ncbi:hypothetical protein [Pseudomarimonas arenosa]|uniref:Uncharacterized protein n=1 Tax=Pseudomarimonas arenosa TaxID=2774145 RepID=A0AAW3ZMU6_9GAMM|nr:hypothetical protein [Pseudomarimonas arenosa]MBD8527293.1 hypothetical protein [Pseudomarimonas arenosa]
MDTNLRRPTRQLDNLEQDRVLAAWEQRYASAAPIKPAQLIAKDGQTSGGHGFITSRELASGDKSTTDIDDLCRQAGTSPQDRERAELMRNAMSAGAIYGSIREDGLMADKRELAKARDEYTQRFTALIEYDQKHNHPVAQMDQPVPQQYSERQVFDWMHRDGRQPSADEAGWCADVEAMGRLGPPQPTPKPGPTVQDLRQAQTQSQSQSQGAFVRDSQSLSERLQQRRGMAA